MFVKSSYYSYPYRFGLTMMASVCLSACQSANIESPEAWWKDAMNERDPQMVVGPRRKPVLNQQFMQSAAPAPAQQPQQPQQPYMAPTGNPASQPVELRHNNATPYEATGNHTHQEPLLLDRIGSWFNSMQQPTGNTSIATNRAPIAIAANIPPANRRKPIANNSQKIYAKEEEVILARASTTPKKQSTLETAMPWGNQPPLDTPAPAPIEPLQLSALIPASGARKEQGVIIEEVSDEMFEHLTTAPTTQLAMGGPLLEDELQAANTPEYPPLRSVPPVPERMGIIQQEHPDVKQELMETKQQSDGKRQQVQQQIKEEASDSLLNPTPATEKTGESPQSLNHLYSLPPSQFEYETPGHRARLTPTIPPSRNVKEKEGYSVEFAPASMLEGLLGNDSDNTNKSGNDDTSAPISVIDEQFTEGNKRTAQTTPPSTAKAVNENQLSQEPQISTSAVLPPPIVPIIAEADQDKKAVSNTSAHTWVEPEPQFHNHKIPQPTANAAIDGYRFGKFKRQVVKIFSILPYYTYMPVLNEARQVRYLPESRYRYYR